MDDSTKQALIAWVKLCPLESEVTSIKDFADGDVFCQLCSQFIAEADDDDMDFGLTPGSDAWKETVARRRRNVVELINDGRPTPLVEENLELGEAGDWVLLEAFFLAAVEGPNREEAITNVMSLEAQNPAVLAALIQTRMTDGDASDAGQGDGKGDGKHRGSAADRSGELDVSGDGAGFNPPLRVDSSDGDVVVQWSDDWNEIVRTEMLRRGWEPETIIVTDRHNRRIELFGADAPGEDAFPVTLSQGDTRRQSLVSAAEEDFLTPTSARSQRRSVFIDRVKATIRKHVVSKNKPLDSLGSVANAVIGKKEDELETIAEMRSHLRDLRSELQGLQRESDASRQASRVATANIREARAKVWYEEDIAIQRSEQLVEFEDECRRLDSRVDLLREELRQDSATTNNDATAELQQRLHEQMRKCAAMRSRGDDLQARLVNAELGTERMEKQNWRRSALRSKITRLEESRQERDRRLMGMKSMQFQEEAMAGRLRDELEEANQRLASQGRGIMKVKYLYVRYEEVQENAQSRLDSYGEELRVLKKGDVNAMCEELTLRRQMAAQLEQNCGDSHTRSMLVQAQLPILEEMARQAAGDLEMSASGSERFRDVDPEMAIEKAKTKKISAELREARHAIRAQEAEAKKIDFQLGDLSRKLREAEAKAELEIEKMNRADKRAAAEKAERRDEHDDLPVPSGPMVAKLREQLLLRERELRWRECNAAEVQRYHDREMELLSGALHQLAIKYGKLLSEAEAAEKDEQHYFDDLEEEALEEAREASSRG